LNAVYRALADPTRRRLLELLRDGDLTAGQLQSHFAQSWPTISGHLRVLREADLVHADRVGTSIRYHLNVSLLEEAMLTLLQSFGINREVNR
jgi:DNA-binding transcriptional ArsR family regulator